MEIIKEVTIGNIKIVLIKKGKYYYSSWCYAGTEVFNTFNRIYLTKELQLRINTPNERPATTSINFFKSTSTF